MAHGLPDTDVRRAPRWFSPGRAAVALAVSLGVHAFLLWQFPELRWGSPEAWRAPSPPPIQLRDAELPPPVAVADRPQLDPQGGAGIAEPALPPPPPVAPPESPLTPAPPSRPLAAADAPLKLPALPAAPPFEPRLARLEAEQQKVPDELAALPRRYDVAVERSPQAPDIVPATLLPAPAPPALPEPPPPGGGRLDGAGGPRAGPRGDSSRRDDEDWARDLARRWGGETPAEVAPARPIEDRLRLTLRVWRPPSDPARFYFEIRIRRREPGGLSVLPKDVLLVQDCSESITQPILDQCKQALMRYLATLSPEDRFDLMSFAETQQRCFGEWRPATTLNRAHAGRFVENLRSRGKTDVLAFLEQVAQIQPEPGRAVIAVLFTDGIPTLGLADNFAIIERFSARNPPAISVFTVGAGRRVNRFLLDLLSHRNRGDSRIVPDPTRVPDSAAALAVELSRPVLIEPRVQFSGDAGREAYPLTLTNLYLDRPLVIYGRLPAGAPAAAVRVSGRAGTEELDLIFPLDWATAEMGEPEMVQRWAWQRILALISEHVRRRDPALVEEMLRIGRAYGIRIPYAEALELPSARRADAGSDSESSR